MPQYSLLRCVATLVVLITLLLPLATALAAPPLPQLHGSIPADEWQSVETEHAILFFTENSPAREDLAQIKDQIEKDVDSLSTLLQMRLTRKFNVLLYPDRLKAPRYQWGLYVWDEDLNTMHVTYDDQFRRRMVYRGGASDFFLGGVTVMFGYALNPKSSFVLAQGLALYVADVTYPKGPIEAYVRQDMEEGKLIPLEQMEKLSEEELLRKGQMVERAPGAFARFLIRNYGFEKFLQVYRKATPQTLAAAMQEVYGKPLATLEGEFHAYLRNYILPRSKPVKERPVD